MANHRLFQLGLARVDPMRCVIRIDDVDKHIEPQVMGVLVHLVSQPGKVITREELLQIAWPDTIVNDGALSKAVSVLRKVLGDSARAPQFIETIPKVGYRVVAPVHYINSFWSNGQHADRPSVANTSGSRKGLASTSSLLNVKLRELTVAQFLILIAIIGLFVYLWPRPQIIELEEEIMLINTEEVETNQKLETDPR